MTLTAISKENMPIEKMGEKPNIVTWDHVSPKLRVLLISCFVSLSGSLWGLDVGSIGPITQMAQFSASIGSPSSVQQGLYVSSFLLSASASSFLSGNLSDWISRKYGVVVGAALTCIGTIISAASPTLSSLIVARILTGAGIGQAVTVANVYLIEIAPAEMRGACACFLQLYICVGVPIGYFTTYGTRNLSGAMAWRAPFIVQGALAALLGAGMTFMPYSPRWLLKKCRKDEALCVLNRLRNDSQASIEAEEIEKSLTIEDVPSNASFRDVFSRRYIKRALLGIFLVGMLQMTGIDAVLYYAPLAYQQAGLSTERASFFASGVTGIVLLICTIPGHIWVDKWGRKKPLVVGGTAMATCLLVIGSLYAAFGVNVEGTFTIHNRKVQWVIIVFTSLFVGNFAWSWALVSRIYGGEIIPTVLRAKVCALEQVANWLVNFAITVAAPTFLRKAPSAAYLLFGFTTLITAIVCLFIPETNKRSLEDIEQLFEN